MVFVTKTGTFEVTGTGTDGNPYDLTTLANPPVWTDADGLLRLAAGTTPEQEIGTGVTPGTATLTVTAVDPVTGDTITGTLAVTVENEVGLAGLTVTQTA